MPDDILNLIDAAVDDWETGPDAVRFNGPPVHSPRAPSPAVRPAPVTAGNLIASRPMLFVGNGPAIPLLNLEIVTRSLVEHANMAAEGFRLMGERVAAIAGELSVSFNQFAQLGRALGLISHHAGPGAPPCACHSAPFPAARDYRRRTRHRNRRRR